MIDHIPPSDPFALLDIPRMCQLEHPRTRHVIMRLFHRIHHFAQFQRADLDDGVSLDEELLQLFRCEMAIRTSVRILCARLGTREDLLTTAIAYKAPSVALHAR
jgi:hypothetical protein